MCWLELSGSVLLVSSLAHLLTLLEELARFISTCVTSSLMPLAHLPRVLCKRCARVSARQSPDPAKSPVWSGNTGRSAWVVGGAERGDEGLPGPARGQGRRQQTGDTRRESQCGLSKQWRADSHQVRRASSRLYRCCGLLWHAPPPPPSPSPPPPAWPARPWQRPARPW